MASFSTNFCSLCHEDDISTQAVSWCLECEDLLCSDCEKHHRRSKTSKKHKVITVNDYETLPPSVLKISNRCTQHNDRFERYCSFHGTPCCIQCVSETHKECKLSHLIDVLQNLTESAAVFHLERDLNKIQGNLQVVELHLLERITKVHNQKTHCIKEIKRVRTSVNEHFDRIERNVLDELSQKEKHIKNTIELLARQIESRKHRVVNLQDSLLKTKQYATDLQILLSIKEIEKQTYEDAKYLEDLEKGDIMADKSLELDVSPALESLQRDIVAFGRISVKSVPSTLKLTRTSQGQTQLSLPVVSTLDKVSLVKKLSIKLSHAQYVVITACAILPTGECVFADYGNDCLVLYDSKGTYVRKVVKTTGQSSEMLYIKDNIVGISFPDEQMVHLIDVSKNKIAKTIQMHSNCNRIYCDDGKLFVRLPNEDAVVIMDLDGKIEQRVNIPGKDVTCIAFYKSYIYCTDSDTDEVLCYDMNGKMVWTHKHEALIYLQSITIDKRSDIIYVAGLVSNNLLAISLDGDQSKIVLSKKDGLAMPVSVHVSTDNTLLVCNKSDKFAFLYKL